jgi:hypothetical protein
MVPPIWPDEQGNDSHERARELFASGLNLLRAHGIAWLEHRLREWPEIWGNDLEIYVYGDFEPLSDPWLVPSLGIVVQPERIETPLVPGRTVHKARVKVDSRTIQALIDATRRINVLLGSFTLATLGATSIGWWSLVTHELGATVAVPLATADVAQAVEQILSLPRDVRKRVDAALYWIREPQLSLEEAYRGSILRIYSGYWNAFECLVEAVRVIHPERGLTRERKKLKKARMSDRAEYALRMCLGSAADRSISECFRAAPKEDQLYQIRNAINHGAIDAENPSELIRVESRLPELQGITWQMFAFVLRAGKDRTGSDGP